MLDYHAVKGWSFPDRAHRYSERDTMLYALGSGYGVDALDERALRFVYERQLLAVPTMASVLCHPGPWMAEPTLGIDWLKVVHAEQKMTFHAPLPTAATAGAKTRNVGIVDKGPGKGAIVRQEKEVYDQSSGERLATIESSYFARGDGGFSERSGVSDPSLPAPAALPESNPDEFCELPTMPQTPLLYRLSGDYNPIHADPEAARKAGFPRPILHGLCTYAMAGHAILRACCDYDPARLASLSARFSAPAFPGETLRVEMWRQGLQIAFRAVALPRNVVVLNSGTATLR